MWRQNAQRSISAYAATNEADTWDTAMRNLRNVPTNILVVGPHTKLSIAHEVAPLLRKQPHMGVLLVMDSLDIDGLRDALRAGVREVLPASTSPEELQQAVGRLTGVIQPLPKVHVVPGSRATGLPTRGKLVMVCSAKGGTGVTTLATNLAAALAAEGRNVALADADPVFGDIALNLGFKASPPVEAGDLPKGLTPEEVIEQLTLHEPTGVQVFSSFRANMPLHQLPEQLVLTVFSGLQAAADVAIVDIPAPLVNAAEYLVHADELFFVANTDVASLKNLRVARQLMADAGLPVGKAWLVLNRIRNMADFEPSRYEQIVGLPVVAALPDTIAVQQAADSTQTLGQLAPKDGATRAIAKLAQVLGGRFDEMAKAGG